MGGLVQWLSAAQNKEISRCVELAHARLHAQHRDRILKLTENFPKDARVTDKDTGEDVGPFWSGMRRFPSPITFDAGNDMSVDYVFNAANLYAFGLGMEPVRDREKIADMAKNLPIPEYVSKKKESDEPANFEQKDDYEIEDDEDALKETIEKLKAELKALPVCEALQVAEFEKDDDSNFHIDFITACSNLRASNYTIDVAPRHKVKLIAGKIIPALATTTAMVTGLIGLELYKLACGLDNIEDYRNAYCNLGIPQVLNLVEPTEPKRAKDGMDPETYMPVVAIPKGFTSWDKICIEAPEGKDLTIAEFNELLKEKHHGVIAGVVGKYGVTEAEIKSGKGMLWTYNPGLKKEVQEEMEVIKNKSLMERYTEFYGDPGRNYVVLDVGCETADGDDAKIPKIKYTFKKAEE